MDALSAYLPLDRAHALARGEALPNHTRGAALFADISGFTPLTEALARQLGPAKWTYYYRYVRLDIFSRYVVGWLLAERESSALAERLITEACAKQHIRPSPHPSPPSSWLWTLWATRSAA